MVWIFASIFAGIIALGVGETGVAVICFIIAVIAIKIRKKKPLFSRSYKQPKQSAADRWLANYKAGLDEDLRVYQENQKKKEKMLDEARLLEEQSKYGMPYEQKELKRRAENLRRDAYRL